MPRNNLKNIELGSKKNIRIIIAGGGTGGHIFPALAIANALRSQDPGIEILFIGARGKMEMEKIPEAGYRIVGLKISGYNRSSLIRNIGLPFKMTQSFLQVRGILKTFKPNAAVGVGGYSSFPVLRMAQLMRIPTFIHESNSYPGKSNIMLGKRAIKVFVASGGMEKYFPAGKTIVAGNPVRKNIIEAKVSRKEGMKFFGLDENKKTVLAIGGSLGAKSINEALALHLDQFSENNLQLIWQTGKATIDQFRSLQRGRLNIWINDFIKEIEMAYAAADIIISRSGGTVYELCVVGKPVVLVPYPFAAEDHQTANAMNLVNSKAALIVQDGEAKEKLVDTVIALSKDELLQEQLKTNIKPFAITNADEVIAGEILKFINKKIRKKSD